VKENPIESALAARIGESVEDLSESARAIKSCGEPLANGPWRAPSECGRIYKVPSEQERF